MRRRHVWWLLAVCIAGPAVLALSLCRAAARGDAMTARATRRRRLDELKAGAPLTDQECNRLLEMLELNPDGDDDHDR